MPQLFKTRMQVTQLKFGSAPSRQPRGPESGVVNPKTIPWLNQLGHWTTARCSSIQQLALVFFIFTGLQGVAISQTSPRFESSPQASTLVQSGAGESVYREARLRQLAKETIQKASKSGVELDISSYSTTDPVFRYGNLSARATNGRRLECLNLVIDFQYLGLPPEQDLRTREQDMRTRYSEQVEDVMSVFPPETFATPNGAPHADLFGERPDLWEAQEKRRSEIKKNRKLRQQRAARTPYEIVSINSAQTTPWIALNARSFVAIRKADRSLVQFVSDSDKNRIRVRVFGTNAVSSLLQYNLRDIEKSQLTPEFVTSQIDSLQVALQVQARHLSDNGKAFSLPELLANAGILEFKNFPVVVDNRKDSEVSLSVKFPTHFKNRLEAIAIENISSEFCELLEKKASLLHADVQVQKFENAFFVRSIRFRIENEVVGQVTLANDRLIGEGKNLVKVSRVKETKLTKLLRASQ